MAPPRLGSSEPEKVAHFERLGANQVRVLVQTGGGPEMPTMFLPAALEWLAQQDQSALERETEARKRAEAISERALATAERASLAAERQAAAAESQADEARKARREARIATTTAITLALINAALTIILFSISH